jgi:hypothetical protein
VNAVTSPSRDVDLRQIVKKLLGHDHSGFVLAVGEIAVVHEEEAVEGELEIDDGPNSGQRKAKVEGFGYLALVGAVLLLTELEARHVAPSSEDPPELAVDRGLV